LGASARVGAAASVDVGAAASVDAGAAASVDVGAAASVDAGAAASVGVGAAASVDAGAAASVGVGAAASARVGAAASVGAGAAALVGIGAAASVDAGAAASVGVGAAASVGAGFSDVALSKIDTIASTMATAMIPVTIPPTRRITVCIWMKEAAFADMMCCMDILRCRRLTASRNAALSAPPQPIVAGASLVLRLVTISGIHAGFVAQENA
jgi:hypothetical protein